jgi:hypothetical protein
VTAGMQIAFLLGSEATLFKSATYFGHFSHSGALGDALTGGIVPCIMLSLYP